MSKPVSKTMIGLFVVGAIALVVVAIGVLGSGEFFKQQFQYYMDFEGSVKGLNVGSPVVYRGGWERRFLFCYRSKLLAR